MPAAPPVTVASRFAALIEVLCRAVAARGGRGGLAGPLTILIWTRLRRMAARFARLSARVASGTPPVTRSRAASPRKPRPAPLRLPRGFAWLVRLVPEAAAAAAQLRHLLADPEMVALLEAAPQAGRLLRPLCRMLGVRPPPAPRRPARAAMPAGPPAAREPPTDAPPIRARAGPPPLPA